MVGKGRSQTDGQIFLARLCRRGERHPECERWYFDLYYPWDERVPRVAQLPDSRLVPITELYTDQELKNSAAYNEALPRGGYQHGLNVRLDGPDGSSIVWTLADSTERGGWGSEQIEIIERLLPHLRQYVQVRRALAGAEALGASLADLLDSTRVGVIHLDQRGGIVEANDRARGILRRGDGLFDQDGFLRARQPADHARLETLLAGALRTHGSDAATSSASIFDHGIEVMQFDPCISGGKAPVHHLARPVALFAPGADLRAQRLKVGYPSVQALPGQHAELQLGHVQPTAVLRRVHQLQLVQQRARLGWREALVQRRTAMRAQVVQDQRDPLRLWKIVFHQAAHAFSPRRGGMIGRHVGPAPVVKGRVVCAGQRPDQVGSSPTDARVRGVISKSGGNASLAGVS